MSIQPATCKRPRAARGSHHIPRLLSPFQLSSFPLLVFFLSPPCSPHCNGREGAPVACTKKIKKLLFLHTRLPQLPEEPAPSLLQQGGCVAPLSGHQTQHPPRPSWAARGHAEMKRFRWPQEEKVEIKRKGKGGHARNDFISLTRGARLISSYYRKTYRKPKERPGCKTGGEGDEGSSALGWQCWVPQPHIFIFITQTSREGGDLPAGCGLYEPPFPCCSQRRAQALFSGTSLIARRGAGTRGVFSPGLLGALQHL